MICPSCDTEMQLRDGQFGEFYFCPNQRICGQKTITKDKYRYERVVYADPKPKPERVTYEPTVDYVRGCPHCGALPEDCWGTGDCGCDGPHYDVGW